MTVYVKVSSANISHFFRITIDKPSSNPKSLRIKYYLHTDNLQFCIYTNQYAIYEKVIDFFNIYKRGNKAGRVFFNYLSISDFIALWDLGYKYKGYPIVEYSNHTFSHSLTYIKDDKPVTVTGVSEEMLGFSPILCAVLEYLCTHKIVSSGFEEYKTLQVMKNILAN